MRGLAVVVAVIVVGVLCCGEVVVGCFLRVGQFDHCVHVVVVDMLRPFVSQPNGHVDVSRNTLLLLLLTIIIVFIMGHHDFTLPHCLRPS